MFWFMPMSLLRVYLFWEARTLTKHCLKGESWQPKPKEHPALSFSPLSKNHSHHRSGGLYERRLTVEQVLYVFSWIKSNVFAFVYCFLLMFPSISLFFLSFSFLFFPPVALTFLTQPSSGFLLLALHSAVSLISYTRLCSEWDLTTQLSM